MVALESSLSNISNIDVYIQKPGFPESYGYSRK